MVQPFILEMHPIEVILQPVIRRVTSPHSRHVGPGRATMNRRIRALALHPAGVIQASLATVLLLCPFRIAIPADAQPVSDPQITEQVVAALRQIDSEQTRRVQVSTEDGVVTLSGSVSPGVAMKSLNAAKQVSGVKKVRNRMSVTQ